MHRKVFKYIWCIYLGDCVKKINMTVKSKITVEGIAGFMIRKVTKFGSGAKVDCTKEFIGRKVYLIICEA